MHRNPSVKAHDFAMTPKTPIPRSRFKMQKTMKSTFDAGYLNPVFVEEVLPGDSLKIDITGFVRLATPLFPIMDNLHLELFGFFVPNRLVWDNWEKFMGAQDNPGDSISFVVPKKASPANGFPVNTIYDLMGIPCVGQIGAGFSISVNALPLRAYNLIYNEWFRDENLINSVVTSTADGPDTTSTFALQRRGKRHDYFTSCLPSPQKGNVAVNVPVGSTAPIKANTTASANPLGIMDSGNTYRSMTTSGALLSMASGGVSAPEYLYADLSQSTGATVNQLRQSIMIQEFLERDARGGTRYTELLRRHFGVKSPDARLQRPEYLGGGSASINVNPIAQGSATGLTGGTTPQGNLAAMGQGVIRCRLNQSFVEHGYLIVLACVRADLTYQQGLRRHWSRSTRYDYYDPSFANLGEQAVLVKEIYCKGDLVRDEVVFGYQERWGEYRYLPSEITTMFNSTHTATIDPWHLAQKFTAEPALNQTFIEENPPVDRILAVSSQTGKQFLGDFFYDVTAARQMPLYSIPGISSLKL